MAQFFASDIHLRSDRPERGERLAHFVRRLEPGSDQLHIVGDLCDFWFASRQRQGLEISCVGLQALADFTRSGGALTILPGNHDGWLGRYYEEALGGRFLAGGSLEVEVGGRRILATHGHRLGARSLWKWAMESRAFLHAFHKVPGAVADQLDRLLDRTNVATQEANHRQFLELYRRRATDFANVCDVLVLGHIHSSRDYQDIQPRLIVLGDWNTRASYLRIDGSALDFLVEDTPGHAQSFTG